MEGTVKLVGLDDNVVGVGENIVRAVVLGDAAKEGIAVQVALVHDVGTHGRRGGLAVSAGHTEALVLTGQCTQHLGTLLYIEMMLTEVLEFLVVGGDGWRIDNQTTLRVTTNAGYLVNALFVVNEHALFLQLAG